MNSHERFGSAGCRERLYTRGASGELRTPDAFFASFFCFEWPWKPKRPTLADLPLREQWLGPVRYARRRDHIGGTE